jgi:hypothetical protein
MRSVQFSALLLCLASAAAPAFAADAGAKSEEKREFLKPPAATIASPITDRLAVAGVFYMPTVATAMRYDSPTTGMPGTVFSGEDTLLLDNKLNQGGVEFVFRMLQRHRIRVDFFKMTRSNDLVPNQVIRFGDNVYGAAGDSVHSLLDMRTLGLAYTYSFFRREKVELSAGLALHLLQAEGELAVPAKFIRDNFDVAGPFATLVFDGTWRFTRRFSANLQAQYLGGNVDTVDGSYSVYHGDVQFRARPNLAFGLGYSQTTLKITSTDIDLPGFFNFEHKGPQAFVRVSY